MKYQNIVKAEFLSRPNRFIAKVSLFGEEETVHMNNTGRCRELLLPGATVYLEKSKNPNRKTKYDLIAVEKKRVDRSPLLVNMDSQIPNALAEEWVPRSGLFSSNAKVKREVSFGSSRFDLYIEDGSRRVFMEVKGVTLEEGGNAAFPDAPTLRGVKHIQELCRAAHKGYEAYILFVIQMKEIVSFSPNDVTHKAFGDALRQASKKGVKILAYDCKVEPDALVIDSPVPVKL
ncbi:MAG: DNA/RNA nuclease SfsA [Clostridia bacterium]|nr:DNA/RNA nuclease SfsA [Clostridia bacterium]